MKKNNDKAVTKTIYFQSDSDFAEIKKSANDRGMGVGNYLVQLYKLHKKNAKDII